MKIVKIPSKDKTVKPNTKCLVAGWGKTEKQNAVNDLMVTYVSTISDKDCKKKWNNILPHNVLCAGTKSGVCQVRWRYSCVINCGRRSGYLDLYNTTCQAISNVSFLLCDCCRVISVGLWCAVA